MSHPVTWFQIQGPNAEALRTFYAAVFDWKMQAMGPDNSMVAPEQPGGIAGGVGASQDGSASVSVFVEVDDIPEALAKIGAAGGTPVMDPVDMGEMGRISGFLDPAKNWVGIWAPPLGMTRAAYHAKNAPPPPPEPKAAKKSAPKKKAKAPAKKAKKAAPKKKAGKKKRR
jgi:uncharacterized protein